MAIPDPTRPIRRLDRLADFAAVQARGLPYVIYLNAQSRLDQVPFDGLGWTLSAPELNNVVLQCPLDQRSADFQRSPEVRSEGGFGTRVAVASPSLSGADRLSVTGQFPAVFASVDVRPITQLLRQMDSYDAELARKPVVILSYAGFEVRGFISQLNWKVEHGLFPSTKFPRMITVSLEVTQANPIQLEVIKIGAQEQSTRHVELVEGQTFESVAYDLYGDPLDGLKLRRINPKVSILGEQAGDTINAPESGHSILDEADEPIAPPMADAGFGDHLQGICEGLESANSRTLEDLEAALGLAS